MGIQNFSMSEDLKDSSLGLVVKGYELIPNKPLLYRIGLYSADIVESILNSHPEIVELWLQKLQEEYSILKKRCDLDQDPSACFDLGFYEEFKKNLANYENGGSIKISVTKKKFIWLRK
jgi:hypothetical protein